ncbi:hypothetical protein FB554_1361 [Barrientosiimonas humi]|uniref:Uncharacterized protein n=1 Tax=Barrientosiimonas humi TaxID=999931 RepID=A0A542XBL0_9MICO|nr:hypothetical protein [Barrientosiimonas humi]TQL33223.1 hypothetical protein FB554_1361 [Barrientosiimonas humi]CAG7573212.1 hypothetical protein BH39T_PBIAJDOK_01839 [Barrientosiimonas humi]
MSNPRSWCSKDGHTYRITHEGRIEVLDHDAKVWRAVCDLTMVDGNLFGIPSDLLPHRPVEYPVVPAGRDRGPHVHQADHHPTWCRLGPECAPEADRRYIEHRGSDFVLRPDLDDVRAEVTVRHDEHVSCGLDHGRTVVVLDLENEAMHDTRADVTLQPDEARQLAHCLTKAAWVVESAFGWYPRRELESQG